MSGERTRGAVRHHRDRGEYRSIYSVMPDTEDFQALSVHGRLMVYTLKLTLGALGIALAYDDKLCEQSGLAAPDLQKARRELVRKEWLLVEGRVHWLRNGLLYEPTLTISNEKHRTFILRKLQGLPRLKIVTDFAAYYGLDLGPNGKGIR